MVESQCWRLALQRHFPEVALLVARASEAEYLAPLTEVIWKAAFKVCTLLPWKALGGDSKDALSPLYTTCVQLRLCSSRVPCTCLRLTTRCASQPRLHALLLRLAPGVSAAGVGRLPGAAAGVRYSVVRVFAAFRHVHAVVSLHAHPSRARNACDVHAATGRPWLRSHWETAPAITSASMSFHVVVPCLYLADLADRDMFAHELMQDEHISTLNPLVDLKVYGNNHNMRLPGAQKLDGYPLLPMSSFLLDGVPTAFAPTQVVQDYRELKLETITQHAWTFVDPTISRRLFLESQIEENSGTISAHRLRHAPGRRRTAPRRYDGANGSAVLSEEAIALLKVYEAWSERRGIDFNLDDYSISESVDGVTVYIKARNGQTRECPVKQEHGSNSCRLFLDGHNRVMLHCYGAERGDRAALECCNSGGMPSGRSTNYVQNLCCRGNKAYCCKAFIGLIPPPLFTVPRLIRDHIVDPNGKKRMAPITEDVWNRATQYLREKGLQKHGDARVIVSCETMASGKSHQVRLYLRRLVQQHKRNNWPRPRFVWATPKTSLVNSTFDDLQREFAEAGLPGFWTRYDDLENVRWETSSIVCCAQSLPKLHAHARTVDVFVADEIRDIVDSATQLAHGVALPHVAQTIYDAKRSILMDAFADESVKALLDLHDMKAVFFDTPTVQPFADQKVVYKFPVGTCKNGNLVVCGAYAFEYVLKQLSARPGVRIHVVTTIVRDVDIMHSVALRHFEGDRSKVRVFFGNQAEEEKKTYLRLFQQEKVDDSVPVLFISSPALVGGVSNFTCSLVVALTRSMTMSAYGLIQATRRARVAPELVFMMMENGLMFRNAMTLCDQNDEGGKDLVLYSTAAAEVKKEVDKQRVLGSTAELMLWAVKDSFGLRSPVSEQRLYDYLYQAGPQQKNAAVLRRLRFTEPKGLTPMTEVIRRLSRGDRVSEALRKHQCRLAMTGRVEPISHLLLDAQTVEHYGTGPQTITDFAYRMEHERINRASTMVPFLLAANQRDGLQGCIDDDSFVVLDVEDTQRIQRWMQDVQLECITEKVLESLNFYRQVLYGPTFADEDQRRDYIAQILKASDQSGSGAKVSKKRSRAGANAADAAEAHSGLSVLGGELLRLQQGFRAAMHLGDSDDADAAHAAAVAELEEEAAGGTEPTAARPLSAHEDRRLKDLYIAVMSFTKKNVDAVGDRVQEAAQKFTSVRRAFHDNPDPSKADVDELATARKALMDANALWDAMLDGSHQAVFRAMAVYERLRAKWIEKDKPTSKDGDPECVCAFSAWAQETMYRKTERSKHDQKVLDFGAVDELLIACGFADGIFSDPGVQVVALYNSPATNAYLSRCGAAKQEAEVERTKRVRRVYKRVAPNEDRGAPDIGLNTAVCKLLNELLPTTTMLGTQTNSKLVDADEKRQATENKKDGARSKVTLRAPPMLALTGPHTRELDVTWKEFWDFANKGKVGGDE